MQIALGWGSLLGTKERKAKQSTFNSFPVHKCMYLTMQLHFFRVVEFYCLILQSYRAQRRLSYSVTVDLPTDATVRESYGLQQCSTAP